MAEHQEHGLEDTGTPLKLYYMKLTEAQSDARMGKLREGAIRPMEEAKARRWLTAGIAVQVSQREYDEQQNRLVERSTAQQKAFQAMNDGHAMWDVSTYRDVLTAPESGLRQAHARGIPLVNVHMLRDDNGDTLPPDADIEDILEARDNLHPDLVAPLARHDRSSVMGGGSVYGDAQTPLSPQHRAMMERVAEQEKYAQQPAGMSYAAGDEGSQSRQRGGGERGARAGRRAGRVSPAGKGLAAQQGNQEPQPAGGEQVGN
jgi:hypothetical protein